MPTETVFSIDEKDASLYVMKVLAHDVPKIWNYFSKKEMIDLWWAPKPWKCETQKMEFEEGGTWLYAMVGPSGEKHFAGADYLEINDNRTINWNEFFADQNGNKNSGLPTSSWLIGFTGVSEGTKLTFNIKFSSKEDLHKTLEMGFEEGFKVGLNQLEELIP